MSLIVEWFALEWSCRRHLALEIPWYQQLCSLGGQEWIGSTDWYDPESYPRMHDPHGGADRHAYQGRHGAAQYRPIDLNLCTEVLTFSTGKQYHIIQTAQYNTSDIILLENRRKAKEWPEGSSLALPGSNKILWHQGEPQTWSRGGRPVCCIPNGPFSRPAEDPGGYRT
eukprot:gene2626-biopygen11578